MEETSLGDFVGDEGPDDAASPEEDGAAEAGGDRGGSPNEGGDRGRFPNEGGEQSTTDPVRPTSVWTPGAARCARCGANVHRRFRDGRSLVCSGCADW